MRTLKTSRKLEGSPVSFRALCRLEARTPPFSLLDVVSTDGVRTFSGQTSAGDVDCTWHMTVWQNGFWSATADFHDGGTIGGDFFFVELFLDKTHAVGVRLEGSLLNLVESRHLSISKKGSDPWIRDNWFKFEASGPSVRVRAAPAVAALVAAPFVALYAAPFVVYAVAAGVVVGVGVIASLGSGKKMRAQRCEDPADSSTACVEFGPVEDTGPPGGIDSGTGPPEFQGPGQ